MRCEHVTTENKVTGRKVQIFQWYDLEAGPPQYGTATVVMWDEEGRIVLDERMGLRDAQAKFRILEMQYDCRRVVPQEQTTDELTGGRQATMNSIAVSVIYSRIREMEKQIADSRERIRQLESAFAELQPALLATADFAKGFSLLAEEGDDEDSDTADRRYRLDEAHLAEQEEDDYDEP